MRNFRLFVVSSLIFEKWEIEKFHCVLRNARRPKSTLFAGSSLLCLETNSCWEEQKLVLSSSTVLALSSYLTYHLSSHSPPCITNQQHGKHRQQLVLCVSIYSVLSCPLLNALNSNNLNTTVDTELTLLSRKDQISPR